jgi:hypothetical protein
MSGAAVKHTPVPAKHEAGEDVEIGQIRESDDKSQPLPGIVDGLILPRELMGGQPDSGMC